MYIRYATLIVSVLMHCVEICKLGNCVNAITRTQSGYMWCLCMCSTNAHLIEEHWLTYAGTRDRIEAGFESLLHKEGWSLKLSVITLFTQNLIYPYTHP